MDVPAKGNIVERCIPTRYIFGILGCLGMAVVYGLMFNFSAAMVGMLNHTAIKMAAEKYEPEYNYFRNFINNTDVVLAGCCVDSECERGRGAKEADGPFEWSSEIQGLLVNCYFWGYLISQLPGARIVERLSAKWVMFFGVSINIICTLLTPVMAKAHYVAVIFMRIGEGIGGGVTFPAMHVLLSKWTPPAERSVLVTLVYSGTQIGTVISLLSTRVLIASLGWESVFYVTGGLSCIWCILWVILVQDSPQQQPLISAEERNMIVTSLGWTANHHGHKKLTVPWLAVLRSKPFWAILVAHACSNWGWYILLVAVPFFMKQVFHINMTENAMTAIPLLCWWFFSRALSVTVDWLHGKRMITITTARKIGTLVATVVPAVCLLALCYIGCHRVAAVALMTIGVTCMGGMLCGFLPNHIDIAPNFAGTLMAITNTVATIAYIVAPIFVGFLTHRTDTMSAWRTIFFVTIALFVIEIMIYTLIGSGEQQPWNNVEEKKEDNSTETNPLNNEEKDDANC